MARLLPYSERKKKKEKKRGQFFWFESEGASYNGGFHETDIIF